MSFNINRLKQNINDFGYIKNNKFEVFVQSPRMFQNSRLNINGRQTSVNDLNNLHRFRIEQVNVPGVSLLSSDVNRYGIGPTQKMPYNAQFMDITFSVLVDRNTDLWDFWYNWVNSIFNFNGQEPSARNFNTGGRIPTYTTKYKDDYTSVMMILMYNDLGQTVKTINLYDAFPSSIAAIPLAWNDGTSLMRLALSITYSTYTIVGSNIISNNQRVIPRSAATTGATSIINA
ncbi:MAG: hypothetical protein [Caudoviricetes sp.]|nr:MAG: hypothetical protein [Caudoviricetes sp.]